MAAPIEDEKTRAPSKIKLDDGTREDGWNQNDDMCMLCLKARAAYTCPRCNLAYCSVSCYRSERHAGCSEVFYKNNFMQALKDTRGSSEDKKEAQDMLSRLETEEPLLDSDDECDSGTVSLEKRLEGLDLDAQTEIVWERLTPQEKQEFDEILRGGGLGSLLEEWVPWWAKHDKELITELGDDGKLVPAKGEAKCKPPAVLDSIPRLSELIKTSPSPLIIFNLVNVLYCYAFVAKLYNGEQQDIPLHAVQSFLEVCTVMSANASFTCVEDAINSAIHTVTQLKSYPTSRTSLVAIIRDAVHIMLGRSKSSPAAYVQAALSDLHELLKKSRAVYKELPKPEQGDTKKSKMAVLQAKKKVVFYLAWVRENQGAMREKAVQLLLLHRTMERDQQKHEEVKADVEANLDAVRARQSKPLIEEIE